MALAFQPSSFDPSFDSGFDSGADPSYGRNFGRDLVRTPSRARAPMAASGFPAHLVGRPSSAPMPAQIPAPIFEHPTVARARSEAMFRRRRIGFALAAVIFGYGLWSLAIGAVNIASADSGRFVGTSESPASVLLPDSELSPLGSLASSTTQATQAGAAAIEPAPTYVVRPGDTLWSIAADLHVGGDLRVVVDQISALNNGAAGLQAGQRLVLPYYPE